MSISDAGTDIVIPATPDINILIQKDHRAQKCVCIYFNK